MAIFTYISVAALRLREPQLQIPLTLTTEGWYALEVAIGETHVRLAVDTGSSLLWLRPPRPLNDMHLVIANFSGQETDLSSEEQQGRFSAQYGRGKVSGEVGGESVRFGDDAAKRTCNVGYVDEQSSFWSKQRTIDGVFGLACGQGAPTGALRCLLPSVTHQQLSGYLMDRKRIVSLQLGESGGMLTVGSIPPEMQGSLVFMPGQDDCGHWSVPLVDLHLENGAGSMPSKNYLQSEAQAIIDSGTDGIVGPTFTVIALAEALGAKAAPAIEGYGGEVSFYTVPCTARLTLPNITLSLGSPGLDTQGSVTLVGEDLVVPPSVSASAVDAPAASDERCHLRLVGWETQSWILGKAFLKRLRGAVFDLDRRGVALAL